MAPTQADPQVQLFALGDFELQSGEVLHDAHLAYRTYGEPGSPAILYPTWYSGTITAGNEWLINTEEHPRRALDPSKYFIIVPALFGNGESTSPSNSSPDMPLTTIYDNVRAQHMLVTQHFGIKKLVAVVGWSMGAAQAYQWASQYPSMVALAIPFCGAARCSPHNWVFLESFCSAIQGDPVWNEGKYDKQPESGLKIMARIYASYGFSQDFYRQDGFRKFYGFKSLNETLTRFWEAWTLSKDANNLLAMAHTWQHADIGAQPLYQGASASATPQAQGGRLGLRGDGNEVGEADDEAFARALRGITAKTLIMPASTDMYFPPADSENEAKLMGGTGVLKVIETIWGHWAGGPGDSKVDAKFIDDSIADFFEEHMALMTATESSLESLGGLSIESK